MKILVTCKRVIDPYAKIHVKADGSGVESHNVKMTMNPFDEIALEEALRIKEKGLANEVIALTIGPQKCQETLRTALAFGADKAIHVKTELSLTPLQVAKVIKKIALEVEPNLILMGKQAIDDDCSQTGEMLATLMDWPQATYASAIQIEDQKLTVKREVDHGLETLSLTLPALITADLRLNEPRYISIPNIMKAKKKPIESIDFETLGINESNLNIQKITPPKQRAGGRILNDVNELIECLRNEAKVI